MKIEILIIITIFYLYYDILYYQLIQDFKNAIDQIKEKSHRILKEWLEYRNLNKIKNDKTKSGLKYK